MIYILSNGVRWKVLWPTQHAAEEGSICGCSSDRPNGCRVTPGCLYIETIGSPDFHFYYVPVCHSVEISGKKPLGCLFTIKVIISNFIVKHLNLYWICGSSKFENLKEVSCNILRVWYNGSRHFVKSQIVCCNSSCCHCVHVVWSQRTQLSHRSFNKKVYLW